MRRPIRALAAAGALATALTLAACQKPVPELTIQSGSVATRVSPTTYAFDAAHVRTQRLTLPEITAPTGGSVLVDVPTGVAARGWAVTALSLAGNRPVVGSSGPLTSTAYRVAAQSNSGNPFIVQVSQLAQGKADGSVWSFLVKISDAA